MFFSKITGGSLIVLIIKGIYVNLDILLLALINSIFAESGFNHIHEKEKFI
jgi:hypothetical protein